MTITASALLSDLNTLLYDENEDVWSEATKLDFINDALRIITLIRPDATAITESFTLVQDTPKQSIPSTGTRFLDAIMNTDGAPIRKTTREELNDTISDWTTETGSAIELVAFDIENPGVFWVYPVPASAFSIEITYADTPTLITNASTTLGVADTYIPLVKDYVLGKCLGMFTKAADFTKSQAYLANFYAVLNVQLKSDIVLQQTQENENG